MLSQETSKTVLNWNEFASRSLWFKGRHSEAPRFHQRGRNLTRAKHRRIWREVFNWNLPFDFNGTDFRHDLSSYPTTDGLIEKAPVSLGGRMTGPPCRACQQLLSVARQVVIRRRPNRTLHSPLFHRFVDLRFDKRGIDPKHHFLSQFRRRSISGRSTSSQSSALCAFSGRDLPPNSLLCTQGRS